MCNITHALFTRIYLKNSKGLIPRLTSRSPKAPKLGRSLRCLIRRLFISDEVEKTEESRRDRSAVAEVRSWKARKSVATDRWWSAVCA